MFLVPFLNGICGLVGQIILLEGRWKWGCHDGLYLVCSTLQVGGTGQSNIHMNARPQEQNIVL